RHEIVATVLTCKKHQTVCARAYRGTSCNLFNTILTNRAVASFEAATGMELPCLNSRTKSGEFVRRPETAHTSKPLFRKYSAPWRAELAHAPDKTTPAVNERSRSLSNSKRVSR